MGLSEKAPVYFSVYLGEHEGTITLRNALTRDHPGIWLLQKRREYPEHTLLMLFWSRLELSEEDYERLKEDVESQALSVQAPTPSEGY